MVAANTAELAPQGIPQLRRSTPFVLTADWKRPGILSGSLWIVIMGCGASERHIFLPLSGHARPASYQGKPRRSGAQSQSLGLVYIFHRYSLPSLVNPESEASETAAEYLNTLFSLFVHLRRLRHVELCQ